MDAPKDGGKGQAMQDKGAASQKTAGAVKQKQGSTKATAGKDTKGKAAAGKGAGRGTVPKKGKARDTDSEKRTIERGKLPAGKERVPGAVDIRDLGKGGTSDAIREKESPAVPGKGKAAPGDGKDVRDKSALIEDKKEKGDAAGAEKEGKAGERKELSALRIIVINPGDPSIRSMWPDVYERSSIFYWGKRKGLILEDDRGPVIDGVAGFISPHGTRITIEGLMRECTYSLMIDFVRFKEYSSAMYPTTLKIFIKNPETSNQELLDSLDYSALIREDPPYRKEIPYRYSVRGSVELLFREYSPMNGFWGIWDMAVPETGRYPGGPEGTVKQPAAAEGKGEPTEKDHIVEIR
ncbi:MAG: hypothetical protein JXA20_12555 [Spirochaetes bacterium]|nr:hypothetical protein [Spirochaetota bacterium]